MADKNISKRQLTDFFGSLLKKIQVRDDVAQYLIEGIIQASLRGVDSHGIRLFPHYLNGFEGGRLNKKPDYKFTSNALSTGKLDGDHAPGHAAGMEGMLKAIERAKESGIGAVVVYNSSHFGAAAYYALKAAEHDMIGLSFTHATAHVLPYGGMRPFLGNNPICLAAPCEGEGPFCLDMATTVATFNKVQQFREQGQKIPLGWGVDKDGRQTEDPNRLVSLFPIGNYKGFGLSMMVEILCAMLTGAPYGQNVSQMFGTPMNQQRKLGHFFVALRIDAFEEITVFKNRLKEMMDKLRQEPSLDPQKPVMAAGDPEKRCYAERVIKGIPVPASLLSHLNQLAANYHLPELTSLD
ncbi:MAG: Ldh family oxidoreductase [Candidatus Vogelbacteria bacterium]|nr:Ldh family oxidoreductase [Candidatus Vogelbacteria bacterium]